MPPKKSAWSFVAPLSPVKVQFIATIIYVPDEIMKQLPKGRLRTKGTMNGAPFTLGIQYRKEGQSFFTVSAPLRRAARIKAGDKVSVAFKLVDPDVIELPEEFLAVLEQDDEGRRIWESFTKGRQRSMAHYVWSVKNVDSRITRSFHLLKRAREVYAEQAAARKKKAIEPGKKPRKK